MLLQYTQDVPVTTTFAIGGLLLSQKWVTTFFAIQLIFSGMSTLGAAFAALSGILAGMCYRSVGSLQRWRFPLFLRDLCARVRTPPFA